MQQAAFGGTPFSAKVDIWMELDGQPSKAIPLSQAGVDFVSAIEPIDLPPGPAWIVVSVDGEEYRNRAYLARGASSTNPNIDTVCYENEVPF